MRRPPIKLAPKPKPAPARALSPMEGTNTSRMLKVAAALSAKIMTSSKLSDFLGITTATREITIPSTKYLMMRFTSSEKLTIPLISDLYIRPTKKLVAALNK